MHTPGGTYTMRQKIRLFVISLLVLIVSLLPVLQVLADGARGG